MQKILVNIKWVMKVDRFVISTMCMREKWQPMKCTNKLT